MLSASVKIFHIIKKVEYLMFTDYIIRLALLPREERLTQIFLLLFFLMALFTLGCIVDFFIEKKKNDKNHSSNLK